MRSQMVADLVRSYNFVGWDRDEVTEFLGPFDPIPVGCRRRGWHACYHVGRGPPGSLDLQFLVFRFDENRIVLAFGADCD
jgi:hypothetical protein